MKSDLKKICFQVLCGIGVLLIVGSISTARPEPTHAQAMGSELPWGGMRFVTVVCTCSSEDWLIVQDYLSENVLNLLYRPGQSILYSNYNVFTSTYLLGTYMPGGDQCRIYVYEDCVDINMDGILGSQPGNGTSAL